MAGVGEQCDRVDQQRGDQLKDEKRTEDRRRDEHSADAGIAAVTVIVAGTHAPKYMRKYAYVASVSASALWPGELRSQGGLLPGA